MENRIIRVTGKGMLKLKPDVTRLTLSLEGICREYADALKRSAEHTGELKKTLEPFGFSAADLKTVYFDVDTEYENYQDKHGTYKNRFVGYRFRHTLKLEFLSDNERLGNVLHALANTAAKPEFRISYTVGDPEAAKNELLGRAVADAKAKAEVLAAAAGVTLSEIRSIDYSWGEIDFEMRPMNRSFDIVGAHAEITGFDIDLEPDDIEANETVTVIWEIK